MADIIKTNIRKKIDLKMSLLFDSKSPQFKLPIDDDTSFDIFCDVYNGETQNYLYIKMKEYTAKAPFFYNRSYELKELYENNLIFKTCDSIEEVRDYLKVLFEQNKVRLRYDEEDNQEIIIMEMDAILFADPIKIEFELYREMVPEDKKDDKLIELYEWNKNKLKKIKEIYSFINNEKGEDSEELIRLIERCEIPGIEIEDE